MAMQGGIVQMISHGFISGAMFLCIGVLYDRMHSRQIADYGGVVNRMPKFAAFFVLFSMANCGLPATSGFVGEFMVILGAVQFNFWIGLLAATALIFGAAYSLWMVKRVVFGAIGNKHVDELTDINKREFFMFAVLAIAVICHGPVPGAVHRYDANLGCRPAQACRHQQTAISIEMNQMTNPNLIPVYAEIFLMVAASAILLIDMFMSKRSLAYYLSLATLAVCGVLTLRRLQRRHHGLHLLEHVRVGPDVEPAQAVHLPRGRHDADLLAPVRQRARHVVR